MRIGFILDGDFRNDSRVKNEARILEGEGHSVFVLNPGINGQPRLERFSKNILIIRFTLKKKYLNYFYAFENLIPLYDLLWGKEIKKIIRKYDLTSVHVHDLYLARAGRLGVKASGIPLILDLHENYPAAVMNYEWANRFPARIFVRPQKWQTKEKEYLSYATSLIVLSENFKKDLLHRYSFLKKNHVFIYPNVPDIKHLQSYNINDGVFQKGNRFILIYFGIISKRRGITTTIEALGKLVNKFPTLHLLLIGPVDKAERDTYSRYFSDPALKNHITHYPWKDISELPSYLAISDICLSPLLRNPQHDSGVANKIYQYMLFGKPLLVSDCLPQKDIIENVNCGRYFRNNNAEDMAKVIEEMMSDADILSKMGERGRQAVLNQYNTDIQGLEILKAHKCHE